MTIDEAIKRCKEESEKYMEYGIETECYQCGKEHEQLAEWLTELKSWKENPFRQIKIKCKKTYDCNNCDLYEHCLYDNWNGYPMEWDLY